MSADATNIKKKGAFRFFTNYKLFAIIGAIAMIGGLGLTAALTTQQKQQREQAERRSHGHPDVHPIRPIRRPHPARR